MIQPEIIVEEYKNGIKHVKPVKFLLGDLCKIDELVGHHIYGKKCVIDDYNAFEVHYICDKGKDFKQIPDGFIYYFVSKPKAIMGGLR